jgi:hypothetical protein
MTMGYKLIGYKEPDPLFEFFTVEDYEKFAEDLDKDLTEGLIPVYVGTFDTPDVDKAYTKNDTKAGVLHKEWVGLTDADKEVLLANLYESVEDLITATEVKLKDKNGW